MPDDATLLGREQTCAENDGFVSNVRSIASRSHPLQVPTEPIPEIVFLCFPNFLTRQPVLHVQDAARFEGRMAHWAVDIRLFRVPGAIGVQGSPRLRRAAFTTCGSKVRASYNVLEHRMVNYRYRRCQLAPVGSRRCWHRAEPVVSVVNSGPINYD